MITEKELLEIGFVKNEHQKDYSFDEYYLKIDRNFEIGSCSWNEKLLMD